MKSVLYAVLYWLSKLKAPFNEFINQDEFPFLSIRGHIFFEFVSPNDVNKQTHHVVAFVLNPGESLDENYRKDLLGPFGFESQLPKVLGMHLYGLDTWGAVSLADLEDPEFEKLNPDLAGLIRRYPNCQIQLAGVRHRPDGTLPSKLNAKRFMLVRK